MIDNNYNIDTEFEKLAESLNKLGLTSPALFFLAMNEPLINMSSIILEAFYPLVSPLFGKKNADLILLALKDRSNYELLQRKIESHLRQTSQSSSAKVQNIN